MTLLIEVWNYCVNVVKWEFKITMDWNGAHRRGRGGRRAPDRGCWVCRNNFPSAAVVPVGWRGIPQWYQETPAPRSCLGMQGLCECRGTRGCRLVPPVSGWPRISKSLCCPSSRTDPGLLKSPLAALKQIINDLLSQKHLYEGKIPVNFSFSLQSAPRKCNTNVTDYSSCDQILCPNNRHARPMH